MDVVCPVCERTGRDYFHGVCPLCDGLGNFLDDGDDDHEKNVRNNDINHENVRNASEDMVDAFEPT